MFTGLIEARVPIRSLEPQGEGARLSLPAPELAPGHPAWEPTLGESIAISGCCLTVIEIGEDRSVAFDLSRETLDLTWFGDAVPGDLVNLERSVRLADRLGGHLVSGHVDGVGRLVEIQDPGDGGRVYTFEVPEDFARYLVPKGSVSIEGISLTVVEPEGCRFSVALIPETLQRTNLGVARPGARLHLEADQIGKWVERLLAERGILR
ncbi:MAG TPA: riboflavin synthase [Planctomycetes bacterium]|nr:riboflavin synthase [Planctomycetota bacterium]